MRRIAQVLSALALAGTLLPSCLFFTGQFDLQQVKGGMLASTVAWFIVAPFWMERRTTD